MKTLIDAVLTFIIGNVVVAIIYSIYCHELNPTHWPIYIKTENAIDKFIIFEVFIFIVVLISSAFNNERED